VQPLQIHPAGASDRVRILYARRWRHHRAHEEGGGLGEDQVGCTVASMRPVRNYCGVQQHKNRYYAVIWNIIYEIYEQFNHL
jgi:hypothetical protein